METTTAKQRVAELVNIWISRAGLRKEAAAARAGLTYQMLYRAYLDPGRPLSHNPDRAIALVRAFVERLTEGERCRADEALTVLDLTGTPLSRVAAIAELFPPAEWHTAFSAHLATHGARHTPQAGRRESTLSDPPYAQHEQALFHPQPCCTALRCGRGGRFAVQLRLEVPKGVLIETGRSASVESGSAEHRQDAERHPIDPPLRRQMAPADAPQPDEDVIVTIRMVV